MNIKSEQEMIECGQKLASRLVNGGVLELIGDVGVGKTTLTRGIAKGLGVKEPVTSPSFTISKSYACGDGRTLTHYDFYRLGDPGIMMEDLSEKIKDPAQVIVIEWGESVAGVLPDERQKVSIVYNNDGTRKVIVQ